MARAQICGATGLSRATVSGIIAELETAGLVTEEPAGAGTVRGRKPGLVRLDRAAGVALGLDFGKRHLRVAVADLGHRVVAERAVEVDADQSAPEAIAV